MPLCPRWLSILKHKILDRIKAILELSLSLCPTFARDRPLNFCADVSGVTKLISLAAAMDGNILMLTMDRRKSGWAIRA